MRTKPVPKPPENLNTLENSESYCEDSNDDFHGVINSSEPQLFTQTRLNDLVRNLGLPKDSAQLLGSNLLAPHGGRKEAWSGFRDLYKTSYIKCAGNKRGKTELEKEFEKAQLDVLCISERKKKGQDYKTTD
ncbi:hypothetical protein ILUMI_20547 [Ignelater luminosus]|uniref:Uncharacterized protein n=1 Tax=Ignelater luminosus TaxID=2038154 RepID=A0A8K0CDX0_IGNLU|nr:hypothetical protein ILUMI_20547 [Ignelater luminosus]